jgi:hypothetical protein
VAALGIDVLRIRAGIRGKDRQMTMRPLEAVWELTEKVPLEPIPAISDKWPEVKVSKVGVIQVHAAPWGTSDIICGQQHQVLQRRRRLWRMPVRGRRCPDCSRLS